MRGRRLLIIGLVLAMLAAVAMGVAGCSLTEAKDKAALLAAIAKFDLKSAPLGITIVSTDKNATVTSDGIPVSTAIQEGLAGMADEWQSVVAKAKKVEGADAAEAENAWSELEEAAAGVPEGATAGEAGAIVGGPLAELMAVRGRLSAAATGTD